MSATLKPFTFLEVVVIFCSLVRLAGIEKLFYVLQLLDEICLFEDVFNFPKRCDSG